MHHDVLLAFAALFVACAGCATSNSAESAGEQAAADNGKSPAIEPTGYRLPVEADALGDDATIRAGVDGRLVVLGDGRYWILSVDGVSAGESAEELESGEWSAYQEGLELQAEGEVPGEVRKFAAMAEAAGVALDEGQSFRSVIDGEGRTCWRVTQKDRGWRAEPLGDEEDDDCTSRWLFTVDSEDGTHRFETYRGDAITYQGDIGLASQTYVMGLERVVQCDVHPRHMYGSSEIPKNRELVDDLGCGWKGGEVTFPVEGARHVDFSVGFDGSLAATVRAPDEGPMVYLVE